MIAVTSDGLISAIIYIYFNLAFPRLSQAQGGVGLSPLSFLSPPAKAPPQKRISAQSLMRPNSIHYITFNTFPQPQHPTPPPPASTLTPNIAP
ncbi:MAG: hypothetical protein LBQ31_05365 [Bacteroidales bacterium]|nr:hypothetical protein [Bacteroidales bacterium]